MLSKFVLPSRSPSGEMGRTQVQVGIRKRKATLTYLLWAGSCAEEREQYLSSSFFLFFFEGVRWIFPLCDGASCRSSPRQAILVAMSDPEPMDEQPGGSSWEEVTDEQGTYYFNSSTGETAWENPGAAPSNLGATLGAALGEKLAAARKAAKQAKQAKQAMPAMPAPLRELEESERA